MNSGILKNVRAEDYGFNLGDMTVAAMIKAYLQEMKAEAVPETLGRIVSANVLPLSGGTVKSRELPREAWYTLDGAELATLRDDVFPGISGKRYVETMPVEMAEFITDCWLAVGGVEA